MDFHQNTVPETDNDNQNNVNYTTDTNGGAQYNQSVEDTVQNTNGVSEQAQMSYGNSAQSPYQTQQPYGNSVQSPYQSQQPYGNSAQAPYQSQQPYGNSAQAPYQSQQPYGNSSQSPYQAQQPYGNSTQSSYQVQQPYGNEGRYPYQNNQNNSAPNYHNGNPYTNNNGNPYYGNNAQGTNTGYNNNGYNPNYGRYAYPVNVSEPGSKLSTAAMVLGIISIITFFTFTVYPAFITGSIAIVLALLSKGRRPKLLNNARIGIICAVIGLVLNVMVITGTIVRYNTDESFREEVNRTFEELYGQSLDEMIEEILEDSGYTD